MIFGRFNPEFKIKAKKPDPIDLAFLILFYLNPIELSAF